MMIVFWVVVAATLALLAVPTAMVMIALTQWVQAKIRELNNRENAEEPQ